MADTNHADTKVTIWLSSGVAGQLHAVSCHVKTAQGREDERTAWVLVRDR